MKKARLLTAALAASLLLGTLAGPLSAQAANQTLAVNFGSTTGTFRGGSTGTLYGLGDSGAPTQALINGAHITNTSQKAPYGTQHPSGDALKVEDGFFAKHGDDMYIYIQDYYPDWAYNGGVRPGDTRTYNLTTGTYTSVANGVWDYLEVVKFVTAAVAEQSDYPGQYVFIPFNEPDAGNWYADWGAMKTTFLADWSATYQAIQTIWAAHGLGHARIGGPGDASWQPTRSGDILTYAKANNVLPDVFIWHELGISNLATYRSHYAAYRALETARSISPIPINITEFGMLRDMGVPGQLIQWLAMFEDTKVDAQVAYWNYAGNISDNSARPNSANAGWWMFKWYGDLEGSQTVAVTPPSPNVADTLQGIGAIDTTNKRATVIFGGTDDDVVLNLTGLSSGVFGTMVDVEVRELTLSGAEGVTGAPPVVMVLDGATVTSGALSLTVPTYDRYAAYQVVVTPEQTRVPVANAVWTASAEAESTALTSATAYTQDPLAGGGWKFLASGGNDVGSFNQVGSKADWTVTVPAATTYRYQVIGSTPGVPGQHALFVDGVFNQIVQYTADLALNATSKWQYRGSAEVQLSLGAGQHVLSLRSSQNGTSVLPNSDITLDKFVLTNLANGEPTTYPAITARYAGGSSIRYDLSNARGFGDVSGTGERADLYAQAWQSGYHDVEVTYRSTGATSIDVWVNGRSVTTLTAASANLWKSTARLFLSQGINEIELRSQNGILLQQLTTTRVASADASAITVQAEAGVMHGAASVTTLAASTGTNASALKYVGWVGSVAANYLEIPRAAGFNTAGNYDVVVTYANAEVVGTHAYNPQVVDRRLDITEAGGSGVADSSYFRYTYSWNSFWERTIPVTLTTSGGSLNLGNSSAWAPNIDKVTIAPVVIGTPTTVLG